MHRFTEFLHSKCPLQANVSSLRSLLALGTGIFILLYLFQPFGISNYSGSIFLMCLGVGILSSCVQGLCSLLFLGIPRRKKGFVTNGDVLDIFGCNRTSHGGFHDHLCLILLWGTALVATLLSLFLLDFPNLVTRDRYLHANRLQPNVA